MLDPQHVTTEERLVQASDRMLKRSKKCPWQLTALKLPIEPLTQECDKVIDLIVHIGWNRPCFGERVGLRDLEAKRLGTHARDRLQHTTYSEITLSALVERNDSWMWLRLHRTGRQDLIERPPLCADQKAVALRDGCFRRRKYIATERAARKPQSQYRPFQIPQVAEDEQQDHHNA